MLDASAASSIIAFLVVSSRSADAVKWKGKSFISASMMRKAACFPPGLQSTRKSTSECKPNVRRASDPTTHAEIPAYSKAAKAASARAEAKANRWPFLSFINASIRDVVMVFSRARASPQTILMPQGGNSDGVQKGVQSCGKQNILSMVIRGFQLRVI